jgi:hypothetical protein
MDDLRGREAAGGDMGRLASRFDYVGRAGLGHPDATLAHAMAWFEGHLYLGTTTPKANGPTDRTRILRHHPGEGRWEVMFESPVLPADDEAQARAVARGGEMAKRMPPPAALAREFGTRALAVFQGQSDPKPCLYAGVMSVWGGLVLRAEDGREFRPVTPHGIEDTTNLSFRGLVALNGWLFAAPAGTVSRTVADLNLAPAALVYANDDPARAPWRRAAEPGFGDPANRCVFSLAVAHGHLYAGTGHPTRGFQLWRTRAEGAPPFAWERVLTDGAWRYSHNLSTGAMAEFGGDLYLGSGIPGLGYDRDNDVGPAACELIRMRPDGSWDLIFGEPRFTPAGLKVPLSGHGPGLDDPYNSVVWAMAAHDGALYLGTHQWEPFDWAMHGKGEPLRGGYQLWGSLDGETWTRLIDAGNGSVTSTGLRTLCSTPAGLYVGTCVHTKLIAFQARLHSGIADIGHPSAGFDVLLGR